ncbi:DUF4125 family protein [uncultured Bifidobacterium sp.]|uniref:DUF4125 family protein n=1 Tax=uncultured Bifidobacterium sp. TaxID=165187 RepID=UPI0028DC196B|nr:DUF4125 family protein [uncultured Bifidobacterium sp.]
MTDGTKTATARGKATEGKAANGTPAGTAKDAAACASAASGKDEERGRLIEDVIAREWHQFQDTDNEGGRAACQGDWPTFHAMRLSQFAPWPVPLLASYLSDLEDADRTGRNLVAEKYARMMESTDPPAWAERIAGRIPRINAERQTLQERIIARQVSWAADFRRRYPRLGRGMRRLRSSEDAPDATSFETYLRGELGTWSDRTLHLYATYVDDLAARRRNLTRDTIEITVRLAGFGSLDEAEAAQKSSSEDRR